MLPDGASATPSLLKPTTVSSSSFPSQPPTRQEAPTERDPQHQPTWRTTQLEPPDLTTRFEAYAPWHPLTPGVEAALTQARFNSR